MIHTRLTPDPKCRDCGGTGCVRKALDCECLLREAKVPLWRRAVEALVGDPRPKGKSMVAGRRNFLKTLATGAAAGVAVTVLPKPPVPGGLYDWVEASQATTFQDLTDTPVSYGTEHGLAYHSIWGSPVIRPELGARLIG